MQQKDFPKTLIELVKALPQYVRDLDDFKLDKQIGKGGFGEVWRAIDKRTNEEVAVKKLFITKLGRKPLLSFIREIFTNAVCKDKFCIKLVGFTVVRPYSIITQFAKGGCLVDYIFPGSPKFDSLSPTKLTIVAMKIAHALSTIQQQNIIHRDIKPANILLSETKNPYVCDFGIARVVDTENFMSRKCGTIVYMAPEVWTSREYDSAADVYSYGMMLWEMSEKRHTYEGYNKQMMDEVLTTGTDRPRFTKKTPNSMKDLISQCWDKDPSKRPTFKQIVKMLSSGKYGFLGYKPEEVIKVSKEIKDTSKVREPKKYCNTEEVIQKIIESQTNQQDDDDDEEPEFLDDEGIDFVDFNDVNNQFRPIAEPIPRNLANGSAKAGGCGKVKPDQALMMSAPQPQFFTHLHQVATTLEPESFETFFALTSSHLVKPMNELVTTHVQYAYCEAMLYDEDFIDFCYKKNLFTNLPTHTEAIINRSLDMLGMLFCYRPNLVTPAIARYIRYFLENRPSEMIIMLSHFIQHLPDDLTPFMQIFDVILLSAQKFSMLEEAEYFLTIIMEIADSCPQFMQMRFDMIKSVAIYFTMSKFPKVVAAAYAAIGRLYDPETNNIPLDFNVIMQHAMNEEIAPSIAALFIKIYNMLPATPEMVHTILSLAAITAEATVLPLLVADSNPEAAMLMVKDDSWYTVGLPDPLDNYRLLLVLWMNPKTRNEFVYMERFPELLAFLASTPDNFLIGGMTIILNKNIIDAALVQRLDQAGFFKNYSNSFSTIRDTNTIVAAVMLADSLARAGEAVGYPDLANAIVTAASTCQESFSYAASALMALTTYKSVASVLKQSRLFADFLTTLNRFPSCMQYVQVISRNVQ